MDAFREMRVLGYRGFIRVLGFGFGGLGLQPAMCSSLVHLGASLSTAKREVEAM